MERLRAPPLIGPTLPATPSPQLDAVPLWVPWRPTTWRPAHGWQALMRASIICAWMHRASPRHPSPLPDATCWGALVVVPAEVPTCQGRELLLTPQEMISSIPERWRGVPAAARGMDARSLRKALWSLIPDSAHPPPVKGSVRHVNCGHVREFFRPNCCELCVWTYTNLTRAKDRRQKGCG